MRERCERRSPEWRSLGRIGWGGLAFSLVLAAPLGLAWADADTTGASSPEDSAPPPVASAPRRMEVPVGEIAGTVTVIERSEIERRQLRTLPDVLREVPGLHVVQSGGIGKTTSIFTRGTEGNHTLILLDGIELGDPSQVGGVFDAADLLTAGLERVEIVRGPQSALYGSEAIGGVINLVTARGRGPAEVTARVEGGAFNTFEQSLGLAGARDGIDYGFTFTNLHSRGVSSLDSELGGSERDGYDNRTLTARFGVQPTPEARLSFVGRFIDTGNEIDAFGRDDENLRTSRRQLFWRGQGELDLWNGRWKPRIAVSYSDYDRKTADDPDLTGDIQPATFDGRRLKLEWLNDVALGPGHTLTLGAETERESFEFRSVFGAFESGANESLRTHSLFVQEQFRFGDRVAGVVGGRLEHHDEFGSELGYRAALAYTDPRWGTRLHGNLGTGFKAPSLADELFSPFGGNPDLDPERAVGFEIGVSQPLFAGRLRVGTTYFQTRTRDLIDAPPPLFQPVNTRRAKADGFETFVDLRVEAMRLRIDHTYTRAEDRDTGSELLRRPSHRISGTWEIRPLDALSLSLGVQYVGKRKDLDPLDFGRETLGGYTVTRIAIRFEANSNVVLFGRVENLFDKDFRDPDGFESPGVAGYLGLTTRF